LSKTTARSGALSSKSKEHGGQAEFSKKPPPSSFNQDLSMDTTLSQTYFGGFTFNIVFRSVDNFL
jgi:hypothetical protein